MPRHPRYFYRVYDEESQSQLDYDDGFCAPPKRFDPNAYWAKYVLARHMDWNSRVPSPFISVTAALWRAKQYCEQRESWEHDGVQIAQIDVATLRKEGVRFWHMQTLARRVDAADMIEDCAWDDYEWVCLHNIPIDAVVDVWKW